MEEHSSIREFSHWTRRRAHLIFIGRIADKLSVRECTHTHVEYPQKVRPYVIIFPARVRRSCRYVFFAPPGTFFLHAPESCRDPRTFSSICFLHLLFACFPFLARPLAFVPAPLFNKTLLVKIRSAKEPRHVRDSRRSTRKIAV